MSTKTKKVKTFAGLGDGGYLDSVTIYVVPGQMNLAADFMERLGWERIPSREKVLPLGEEQYYGKEPAWYDDVIRLVDPGITPPIRFEIELRIPAENISTTVRDIQEWADQNNTQIIPDGGYDDSVILPEVLHAKFIFVEYA